MSGFQALALLLGSALVIIGALGACFLYSERTIERERIRARLGLEPETWLFDFEKEYRDSR